MSCGARFKKMNRNSNPAQATGPTNAVGAGVAGVIRTVIGKNPVRRR